MTVRPRRAARRARVWLLAAGCVAVTAAGAPDLEAQAPSGVLVIEDVLSATLKENPDVKGARATMDAARGALVQSARPFDAHPSAMLTGSRAAASADDLAPSTASTESTFGLSKLLRSGLTVGAQVAIDRTVSSASAFPAVSQAATSVGLTVPLSQGRGGGIYAATERSAALDLTAGTRALRATAGQAVFRAVVAYWEYRAAYLRADIQRAAADRARQSVNEVQILIAADERPKSDVDLMMANAAIKQATHVEAERQIVRARTVLAAAIGIDLAAATALHVPATDLPEPDETTELRLEPLVAAALARHDEVAAALARKESASVLRAGALSHLRPRVDLVVGFAHTARLGGIESRLIPGFGAWPGPSASAQLVFEPTYVNSAVRGAVITADAAYAHAAVAADALARTVPLDVADALAGLTSSRAQLSSTGEAMARSRLARETVQRNFELGTATLFDRILAEDTVTNAELADLNARLRHAIALAQLQFARGVLIDVRGSDLVADAQRVLRVTGERTTRE